MMDTPLILRLSRAGWPSVFRRAVLRALPICGVRPVSLPSGPTSTVRFEGGCQYEESGRHRRVFPQLNRVPTGRAGIRSFAGGFEETEICVNRMGSAARGSVRALRSG